MIPSPISYFNAGAAINDVLDISLGTAIDTLPELLAAATLSAWTSF
jgi:hypothetical protein